MQRTRLTVLLSLLFGLFVLASTVPARASPGVVVSGSLTPSSVSPGGKLMIVASAANVTAVTQSTKVTISIAGLPAYSATVPIKASASYSVDRSFTLPTFIPAGTYAVTVTATTSGGSSSATLKLTVK